MIVHIYLVVMCCNTLHETSRSGFPNMQLNVFAAPELATPGGFLRSCPCTTSEEEKGVWGVIESSVRLRRRSKSSSSEIRFEYSAIRFEFTRIRRFY